MILSDWVIAATLAIVWLTLLGVLISSGLMLYWSGRGPKPAAASPVQVKTEVAEIRREIKTEVAGLRNEMKIEVAGLRNEMKSEVAGLRNEMKSEIAWLRNETKAMQPWQTQRLPTAVSEPGTPTGEFWGDALMAKMPPGLQEVVRALESGDWEKAYEEMLEKHTVRPGDRHSDSSDSG